MVSFLRRSFTRPQRHASHYEHVLGTSLELQAVATSLDAWQRAESAVLAEVDRLERILSSYSATSELSRWQVTYGVDVPVSPELADVLGLADDWRQRTSGAFHPSAVSMRGALGPTTPPWHVDRDRGVARRTSFLEFSLDALAKGYIVERAALRARDTGGVTQVLLNIGGDLRHVGDRPLPVAVTDPRSGAENAAPIATVCIHDEALATSGDYRRSRIVDGRAVSHIIDPRTGQPAGRVISASVIAPDCTTADALSTAFSVLAPEESIALANAMPGVACLLVERNGTLTANDAWRSRAQ